MIQIRAIGKLKSNTPEFQLIQDYLNKTREKIEVKEFVEKKALTDLELKNAEAKLLLSDIVLNLSVFLFIAKGFLYGFIVFTTSPL